MTRIAMYEGDCLGVMRGFRASSVDLVMCSPPYEAARTYGIGFKLRRREWVEWAADRFMECLRISRGLVVWVVDGQTRQYEWSATPMELAVEIKRRGAVLRKPPVYVRDGIPGSGGPDWWKNKYEFCLCATSAKGRLAFSDPTACGHPPKFAPGGEPSHRLPNGRRCNLVHTKTMADGSKKRQGYVAPKIANPGNVIECVVGGGRLGDDFAHESEAPFPEQLAERFVRSFCPPGGVVLDCFGGSGTVGKVAAMHGRNAVLIDIRAGKGGLDTARRRIEAFNAANPDKAARIVWPNRRATA